MKLSRAMEMALLYALNRHENRTNCKRGEWFHAVGSRGHEKSLTVHINTAEALHLRGLLIKRLMVRGDSYDYYYALTCRGVEVARELNHREPVAVKED